MLQSIQRLVREKERILQT
ncbi:hypothetical protein PHET_11975 [Paragonimus heterotremus]|uniref:Uncharacterized protein n=1 Tax=Paragonimus heterotremus TaxID=100268 RepID=A0A8J4SKN5_9TREM|nr:hypothetical protein PHET_11975 [Paragonimus heterotremus]